MNRDRAELGFSFSCECGRVHKTDEPKSSKKIRVFQTSIFKGGIHFSHFKKRLINLVTIVIAAFKVPIDKLVLTTNPRHIFTKTPQFKTREEELYFFLRNLIHIGWKAEHYNNYTYFNLNPSELNGLNIQEAAEKMLAHVRMITKLLIPFTVPTVSYKKSKDGSGVGQYIRWSNNFKEITIDPDLINHRAAAMTTLAHELCHFILYSNKIFIRNTAQNERLTDVCMFVVGFGGIVMRGNRYRKKTILGDVDTRLGYLSTEEYENLYYDVKKLRRNTLTPANASLELLNLQTRLYSNYGGDKNRVAHSVTFYQKKYPHLSEVAVIKKILFDLERDRR